MGGVMLPAGSAVGKAGLLLARLVVGSSLVDMLVALVDTPTVPGSVVVKLALIVKLRPPTQQVITGPSERAWQLCLLTSHHKQLEIIGRGVLESR